MWEKKLEFKNNQLIRIESSFNLENKDKKEKLPGPIFFKN